MGTEPTWRSLAASLSDEDFSSPYLDRVRDFARGKQGLRSVQREIVAEMAYALKKAETKVNEALLECDLRAALYLDTESEWEREDHVKGYAAARQRARRAKWEYMVHREAIGLLWTDEIDSEFPLPPSFERKLELLSE